MELCRAFEQAIFPLWVAAFEEAKSLCVGNNFGALIGQETRGLWRAPSFTGLPVFDN
jgi:hypothetical protein